MQGGVIEVGGPGLAESLERLDLVDGYCLMMQPVVLGGGKPFFGGHAEAADLRLVDSRTFGSGAIALTYERL